MNNKPSYLKEVNLMIQVLMGLVVMLLIVATLSLYPLITGKPITFFNPSAPAQPQVVSLQVVSKVIPDLWQAPAIESVKDEALAKQIAYGQELVAHTAVYLGPEGSVAQLSNGLNCQNCHLNAGTKPFGNNYGSVASTYPKMRGRSGAMEDIPHRINDCFERSLNGKALDENSKELKAMVAYIEFLGTNVPKGEKAKGSGIWELELLDRAADPIKGQVVYENQCKVCHGTEGQGQWSATKKEYTYPPLWGEHSFNDRAGLYRISRFAGYVKTSMPLGASYDNPILTDEEAWDVAAYVNSQARPSKDFPADWPDISKKPMDHPFGPFADEFSEEQHKYGPFKPMKKTK